MVLPMEDGPSTPDSQLAAPNTVEDGQLVLLREADEVDDDDD